MPSAVPSAVPMIPWGVPAGAMPSSQPAQPVGRVCPGLRLHTPITARAQRTEGLVYVCGMPLEVGQDRCKSCASSRRRRHDHLLRAMLRPDWDVVQAQTLGERVPDPIVETPPVGQPMRGLGLGPGSPREKLQRFLNGTG